MLAYTRNFLPLPPSSTPIKCNYLCISKCLTYLPTWFNIQYAMTLMVIDVLLMFESLKCALDSASLSQHLINILPSINNEYVCMHRLFTSALINVRICVNVLVTACCSIITFAAHLYVYTCTYVCVCCTHLQTLKCGQHDIAMHASNRFIHTYINLNVAQKTSSSSSSPLLLPHIPEPHTPHFLLCMAANRFISYKVPYTHTHTLPVS